VRFSPTRPGSPVAVEATAPAPTAPATYSVAKGDNLWTIAKKNGVTVKQLTAANNLRSDSRLSLGQKLVIPGKAAAAPAGAEVKSVVPAAAAPAAAPTAATVHVVKSGESLGAIAKKYQVKVGDIATANNIADPTKLRVGQSLKIPGSHSGAAKSATSTVKPAATTTKPAPKAAAPAPAPVQTPAAATAPAAAPVFTSPVLETAPAAAPAAGESPLIAPASSTTDAPVIRVEEAGAAKSQ
jgi:LysM repeat protein